jgi:hypothetical protein
VEAFSVVPVSGQTVIEAPLFAEDEPVTIESLLDPEAFAAAR